MDIKKSIGAFVLALIVGVTAFLAGQQPSKVAPPFGALSNTEFPTNWIGIGGAHTYALGASLKTGTTTVCSVQSPSSTSTVQAAQIRFDVASTSAITVKVGQSSVNSTIATQIGTNYAVAANAQAFIQASTTPSGPSVVLAPNAFINFQVLNGGANDVEAGTCQVEFLAS